MDNIIEIHKKYLEEKNLKKIANKLGIHPQKISYQFKKHNLPLLKNYKTLDTNYFEKINSPEKAYFLGLMYADGNVYNRSASISLQECDKHILESFKNNIKHHNNIIFIPKYKAHHSNQYKLYLNSIKIVKDLILLGCVPNKSNIISKLPEIDYSLYKYFILGYFDGDGGIRQDRRKAKSLSWSIVGNYDFLLEIRNILDKNNIFRTTNNLHKCTNSNKYTLDYSNYRSCKELFILFYNFKSPYLFRKYDNFKKYIQEYSGNENLFRKIEQRDLNNIIIKEWDNIDEIKKELKITDVSKIYKCLNGLHKTSMNYIWTYKKD